MGIPDPQVGIPDPKAGIPDPKAGISDPQARIADPQVWIPDTQVWIPDTQAGIPDPACPRSIGTLPEAKALDGPYAVGKMPESPRQFVKRRRRPAPSIRPVNERGFDPKSRR